MCSIAQCLLDLNAKVAGCDLKENFQTQSVLDQLPITIDIGFDQLPNDTDCVIYTSAHQGPNNPIVKQAQSKNIPTLSQAEVLGLLFNHQSGIAVCGVGGKSSTAAMITWILKQNQLHPSFSVGVGKINQLERTGAFQPDSTYFVSEADEYVIDPKYLQNHQPLIPRFSFLNPYITVCTNLSYDHPDVYPNYDQTKETFLSFFNNIKKNGQLIYLRDQEDLHQLALQLKKDRPDIKLLSFGHHPKADMRLVSQRVNQQSNQATVLFKQQFLNVHLSIPGKFNIFNALAAILSCLESVDINDAILALKTFSSTSRRFELISKTDSHYFYDDYAHHPHEIKASIEALKQWHPESTMMICFQPHTYSRTKELFHDFCHAFQGTDILCLSPIFASAREKLDPNISSLSLADEIKAHYPQIQVEYFDHYADLATYIKNIQDKFQVCMTMGAGDINQVYDLLI